jgi:hypothetical protein
MQKLPNEGVLSSLGVGRHEEVMDNQTAARLKRKLAEEFREQLATGIPSNDDEEA